jgi:predicted DNA-binding transcriptional regulator AlpA
MVKRGEFPAPIHLSAGRVGWVESVVSAWIAAKMAEAA